MTAFAVKPEGFDLRSRNGGKCSICARGDSTTNGVKDPVLWLGLHIEWEGNFDICFDCARQIGEAADMVLKSEYRALSDKYSDVLNELLAYEQAVTNKEDAIKLLSGELVGAAHRGVYGSIPLRELDTEPDFAESLAEREQASVDS